MDNTIKLLEIILPFLQALIWPLALLAILRYFGNPIKTFIESVKELTFKAPGGVEAKATRLEELKVAAEAGASLGAAETTKGDDDPNKGDTISATKIAEIGNIVSDAVIRMKMVDRFEGKAILWVDDKPIDNFNERGAFEALGVNLTVVNNLDDALQRLNSNRYSIVISSIDHEHKSLSNGYLLIEKIKRRGIKTPVIIYIAWSDLNLADEAKAKGAYGITSSPQVLFLLVTEAIEQESLKTAPKFDQRARAEYYIMEWLQERYPHSKLVKEARVGDNIIDFIIQNSPSETIGVEVKSIPAYRPQSHLTNVFRTATSISNKKHLSQIIIIFVFVDLESAFNSRDFIEREINIPTNTTLVAGIIQRKYDDYEFSIVSTFGEALPKPLWP